MTFGSLLTQTFLQPSYSTAEVPSLVGKVAIVTGASTGLGKITALELARKGAHVFCMARSDDNTRMAVEDIKALTHSTTVEMLLADFLDLRTVEAAADNFLARGLPLDILVNNAGIMFAPWQVSKQGIESQFATNHFGSVVLTMRLLPALKRSKCARIVNLSSLLHEDAKTGIDYETLNDEKRYNDKVRYAETKLANIHFTRVLQSRLEAAGIANILINAVHPGVVRTELGRHATAEFVNRLSTRLFIMAMISPQKGALTQIYVATDPDIERLQYRGRYFVTYAALAEPSKVASNDKLAAQTWDWTERILKQHYRRDWSFGL